MDQDQRLRDRLDRLAGRVDRRGVWESIQARATAGESRGATPGAVRPQASARRRKPLWARVAVGAALSLVIIAGIVVGTSFGLDDGLVVYGTDGGREGYWQQLPLVEQGGEVWSLATDPDDHATLYATTRDGIYKSTDGAVSWKSALSAGQGHYWLVQISPSPSTLIAMVSPFSSISAGGFSPRLMRSDDGGTSWTEITENLFSAVSRQYPGSKPGSIGIPSYDEAAFPGTIFLSVEPPVQGPSPFWRSTDRGTTWTRLDETESDRLLAAQATIPPESYEPRFRLLTDVSGAVLGSSRCVVVDPDDPSLVYAGTTTGVCRSTDGGDSWVDASAGIEHRVGGRLVVEPELPSTLYVVAQEGVFKSGDAGATWRSILSSGYLDELGNTMCSFALAPSRPATLYAWTSDGLFRSEDGGETWSARAGVHLVSLNTNDMSRTLVAVAPDDPDIVFARVFADTGSDLLRSVDGGDSWTTVLENVGQGGLQADPNDHSTLYVSKAIEGVGSKYSVAKSVDKGATWQTVLQDDTSLASFGIAVGVGDPAPVYTFGSLSPYLATLDAEGGPKTEGVDLAELEVSISRSLDRGAAWQDVEFSGLPGPIEQLICDPRAPGVWYALSILYSADDGYGDREIYRSTDEGFTWVTAFEDTPPGCGGIEIGPGPDGSLYAYGSLGIYRWVPAD